VTEHNILKKIIEVKDKMPKKQKQFCEYILSDYHNIELYSVNTMAEKSGVGTTTILRTIHSLGIDNLNDFKHEMHQLKIDSHAPTWWQFEKDPNSKVHSIWENINQIQQYSMNDALDENIQSAVELLLNTDRINIFGLRSSRPVALYLENSINQFYPKCYQLSHDPHFIFDRLYHAKEGEVIILIALSQYTQLTYQVAQFASQKHLKIILITDSKDNSIIPLAEVSLILAKDDRHYTIVPAVSLVETLTVLLGSKLGDDSKAALKNVGQLIAEKDITQL
jgi:DNA-binding MurR/RpiR family transcriptional regulator